MNQDFEEFFASLNAHSVEYLIIGGVAYNFYAPPRATKDIDIWVRPDVGNVTRLHQALTDFGFPTDSLDVDVIAAEDRVIMLGRVPNRIDILTRPRGVVWSEVVGDAKESTYGDVPVRIIGIDALISAKMAAGRPRDLADVEKLLEIRGLG